MAESGPDRLYRIGAVADAHGGDWLARLPWPELRTVRGRGYLVGTHRTGYSFTLQGADRFVAYVENTSRDAHLRLRLPAPMRGHFTDALTGSPLGPVTVLPVATTDAPWRLPLPAGRRAVVLTLTADAAPLAGDLPAAAPARGR